MSGVWKRNHGRTSEAPPDERGGNRYVRPTAAAPHLDSTPERLRLDSEQASQSGPLQTSHAAVRRQAWESAAPPALKTVPAPALQSLVLSPIGEGRRNRSLYGWVGIVGCGSPQPNTPTKTRRQAKAWRLLRARSPASGRAGNPYRHCRSFAPPSHMPHPEGTTLYVD